MDNRPLRTTSTLSIVILALGLGLIVAWASLDLRFDTRSDAITNLTLILQGRPLIFGPEALPDLPFYNRVMIPELHALLVVWVPIFDAGEWYLLLRIVTFMAAFGSFAFACGPDWPESAGDVRLAMALLALATIVSFSFPWEEPSDALDICALSLAVAAARNNRLFACFATSLIFAANRESAAYAGIIWFFLSNRQQGWLRRAVEGAAICIAAYGVVIFLRATVAGWSVSGNWFMLFDNVDTLIEAVDAFTPLSWLGLLPATLAILLAIIDRSHPLKRRLLQLAALLAVPSLLFGKINELRVFLPSMLMLAFAVGARWQAGSLPGLLPPMPRRAVTPPAVGAGAVRRQ